VLARFDEYTAITLIALQYRDRGYPSQRTFEEVSRYNMGLDRFMGTPASEWVDIIIYVYKNPTKGDIGLLDWAWEACKQPAPTPPR
jgi:hypothetical protein